MENLICFWLASAWHFFKPTSLCIFPCLGEVATLTGLNIGDNPLRFPTQDIISQGVVEILKYLRLMLLSKSNGSFRPGSQLNGSSAGSPSANGDADHADSDSDEDPFSAKRIRTRWVPCGFLFFWLSILSLLLSRVDSDHQDIELYSSIFLAPDD